MLIPPFLEDVNHHYLDHHCLDHHHLNKVESMCAQTLTFTNHNLHETPDFLPCFSHTCTAKNNEYNFLHEPNIACL